VANYPIMITVSIDGKDVTQSLFGVQSITPTDLQNTFKDIDITPFIRGPGTHSIAVYTVSGAGQVETRIEVR